LEPASRSTLADVPQPRKSSSFDRIVPGFDLTAVRCRAERGHQERVIKNEDPMTRIKALSDNTSDSFVEMRKSLLTDATRGMGQRGGGSSMKRAGLESLPFARWQVEMNSNHLFIDFRSEQNR